MPCSRELATPCSLEAVPRVNLLVGSSNMNDLFDLVMEPSSGPKFVIAGGVDVGQVVGKAQECY